MRVLYSLVLAAFISARTSSAERCFGVWYEEAPTDAYESYYDDYCWGDEDEHIVMWFKFDPATTGCQALEVQTTPLFTFESWGDVRGHWDNFVIATSGHVDICDCVAESYLGPYGDYYNPHIYMETDYEENDGEYVSYYEGVNENEVFYKVFTAEPFASETAMDKCMDEFTGYTRVAEAGDYDIYDNTNDYIYRLTENDTEYCGYFEYWAEYAAWWADAPCAYNRCQQYYSDTNVRGAFKITCFAEDYDSPMDAPKHTVSTKFEVTLPEAFAEDYNNEFTDRKTAYLQKFMQHVIRRTANDFLGNEEVLEEDPVYRDFIPFPFTTDFSDYWTWLDISSWHEEEEFESVHGHSPLRKLLSTHGVTVTFEDIFFSRSLETANEAAKAEWTKAGSVDAHIRNGFFGLFDLYIEYNSVHSMYGFNGLTPAMMGTLAARTSTYHNFIYRFIDNIKFLLGDVENVYYEMNGDFYNGEYNSPSIDGNGYLISYDYYQDSNGNYVNDFTNRDCVDPMGNFIAARANGGSPYPNGCQLATYSYLLGFYEDSDNDGELELDVETIHNFAPRHFVIKETSTIDWSAASPVAASVFAATLLVLAALF